MAWDTSVTSRMNMYAPMNEQIQRQNQGFANLGSKIGSIAGGMIESSQAEKVDAQKKAKINEFIQAYNNPNSPEFQGLEGSQRALKLSRLLMPLDAEMSARWEKRAMELQDQVATAKEKGLALDKEIAGKKSIAEIEATTKAAADKAKADAKMGEKTPANELFADALGAFESNTYEGWYNRLNPLDKARVPNPASVTRESIQTLSKKDLVAGANVGNDISMSNLKLSEQQITNLTKRLGISRAQLDEYLASSELDWRNPEKKVDANGNPVKAPLIPAVQEKVDAIKADYRKDIAPHNAMQEAIYKVEASLPKSGPIIGFDAVATINAFNKVIDPSAVVRDSDFQIAAGASGGIEKVKSILNSYLNGNTLTEAGVQSLRNFLKNYQNMVDKSKSKISSFYSSKANKIGGGASGSDIEVDPYGVRTTEDEGEF